MLPFAPLLSSFAPLLPPSQAERLDRYDIISRDPPQSPRDAPRPDPSIPVETDRDTATVESVRESPGFSLVESSLAETSWSQPRQRAIVPADRPRDASRRVSRRSDPRNIPTTAARATSRAYASASAAIATNNVPRRLLQTPADAAPAGGCPDLTSGALKFAVTTWTSLPSEDLVRVGAVDAATSGGAAAAREMYVSVVVTNARDSPVSLRGVTVAFEFSRVVVVDEMTGATEVADPDRFVFMCWGAQLMPTAADGSDGGHRAVPCSEIILDIDAVGPRVTFGDVRLQPGEFLVGGYSNFLFSFKEMNAAPMENAITLLAPYCDAEATTRDARELALLAPTFMLGGIRTSTSSSPRALRSSTWSSTASSPRLTPTTSASPSHRGS